jgi:hypothetical protein
MVLRGSPKLPQMCCYLGRSPGGIVGHITQAYAFTFKLPEGFYGTGYRVRTGVHHAIQIGQKGIEH